MTFRGRLDPNLAQLGLILDRLKVPKPLKKRKVFLCVCYFTALRLKTPKMAPRRLQERPKRPQDGPKRRQEGAKSAQEGPRRPQEGSKSHFKTILS